MPVAVVKVVSRRSESSRYAGASLTVRAIDLAAGPAEAGRWMHWLASVGLSTRHDGLPPVVLGVCGERFEGARPVRRGNAAWSQRQLDIPGEILDAAWTLRANLGALDPRERDLLVGLADAVVRNWREDDSGIWEGREGERAYTHSKVRCWVALDRAIRLADRLNAGDRTEAWRATAEEIRAKVLDEGFVESVGAFTRGDKVALLARGTDGLDATADDVRAAGGEALAIQCDVADAQAVERAAARVERELGPIDVWVNDAMVSALSPFAEMEADEFDRITRVVYLGTVNGTRAALARMAPRRRGTVVQVGSALAYRGIPCSRRTAAPSTRSRASRSPCAASSCTTASTCT